jgi:hypothetical protein
MSYIQFFRGLSYFLMFIKPNCSSTFYRIALDRAETTNQHSKNTFYNFFVILFIIKFIYLYLSRFN